MATNNKEFKVKHGLLVESGNVGIGTTSPSSLLHLESASSPTLQLKDTTNNVTFKAYAQNSNAHLATTSNHDLIIDTNNTERIRILAGGLVGIGKTPSTWFLDVDSSSTNVASFDGSNNTGVVINSSSSIADIIGYSNSNSSYNALNIRGASGTGLVVDTSNNVGIGTTSPFSDLSINVGANAPSTSGNMASEGLTINNGSGGRAIQMGVNESGAYNYIQSAYVNNANVAVNLAFFTGNTERMRIDSSGKVGIGTATPGALLTVNDGNDSLPTIAPSTKAIFATDNTANYDASISLMGASNNGSAIINFGDYANEDAGQILYKNDNGGSDYMAISVNTSEAMRISHSGDATFQGSVNILDGSTDFTISGDSNTNTYFISNGEFRIRPLGTSVNKLVIGSNGNITTAGNIDVAGDVDVAEQLNCSGTGSRMSASVQNMFHIGAENHASQINRYGNTSTRTYVDGGSSGYQGYVWGQENWLPATFIPYSPNQVYRISASIYQLTGSTATSGASSRHYLGLAGYDENFNFLNVDAIGTYQYILASNATVSTGNFLEVDVTLKGWNGSGQSDGNKMDQGTVYIRPLWLANYQSGGGTAVLTGFTIMPAGTIADNDSNAGTNY